MSVKVVCPSCHISLDAPNDLLGETVKCEECGTTFTARAPARPRSESAEPARASKARSRRIDDDDEDDDHRPRRSSRRDDDDDDRPRRRSSKKKGNSALPFLLAGGGLVFFVLLVGGVGLYFLFGRMSKSATAPASAPAVNNAGAFAPLPAAAPLPNNVPPVPPNNPPAAAGQQKVTLSNPRWSGGFTDFEVNYQTANGQRLIGIYALKWKYADGNGGSANLHMSPFDGGSGTWKIRVLGGGFGNRGGRQAMEIWVEEGAIGHISGSKVSNTVSLN